MSTESPWGSAPPPPPPSPAHDDSRRRKRLGVAVGVVVPLLTFLVVFLTDGAGWWVGQLVWSAVAFLGVALLFWPRTRSFGLGILLGFAVLLLVGAGACTAMVLTMDYRGDRPMTGMPLRDYRVHRYVNAFCPHCHEERPDQPLSHVRRLSGWLAVRDDRVFLERGCPEHGLVRTMYDESAEILSYLEQWTAPTKAHEPDLVGNFKPVPSAYEDGLPEMQTQHTCILLEDITDHCNLRCPTCFAESSPALSVSGAARSGARVDRRPSGAGERAHRRADALGRGAHPLPAAGRAARRGVRSAGGARADQHQRAAGRHRRRAGRAAAASPGTGGGLPAVRR